MSVNDSDKALENAYWNFDARTHGDGKYANRAEPERDAFKAAVREHVLTAPIPMLLRCPYCRERHIDTGEFATKPHHTHACQKCGEVWRPAIVATIGVQFLPGFKSDEAI